MKRHLPIVFLIGSVVALIVTILIKVQTDAEKLARQEADFMAECAADRQRYECVAMWRAGARSTSDIVVIPKVR